MGGKKRSSGRERLRRKLSEANERVAELEEEHADLLRALAASVRSERRLQALWTAPVDLILVIDIDGTVREASLAAAERFGMPHEEFVGTSIWAHLSDEVSASLQSRAAQVVQSGQPARSEDEQGGRWLASALFPIRDAHGDVVELGVIASDITDRKRAAAALGESEERYRAVAENALAGIGVSDENETLVYANVSFAAMLGYQVEEMVGMSLGDMAEPDELARFQQFTSLRRVDVRNRYETRLRRKDGSWALLEVSAAPMKDPSGAFLGTLAVIVDITDRQHAHALLRESEERYRAVAENALAGIGISDENETLVYVNHSFAAMIGYDQEEIVGLHLGELVDSAELERFEQFTEMRKDGVQNRYETRLKRKDGSVAHLEVSAAPMWDSRGGFLGTLAVLLDMTERVRAESERRELEAQVQHAEKLKSLGVMAGGIAHDFNNLLASILGNADIAMLDLPPDSEVRAPVEDILHAARRAADLTQHMLAYSGKSKMVAEETDLAVLVRDLHSLLQSIVAKTVTLDFALTDDLPAIQVDPSQIRQVVMGLVANASEAIGEARGRITVTTSVTRRDRPRAAGAGLSSDLREGLYVTLEVADSGCGMDEETRARIFEPFFTTKFPGRGLGLASMLGILRGHHGGIEAESEPGQGSTFTVFLPALDHSVRAERHLEEQQEQWLGSGTVLVVDDEEGVRRVAQRMLLRLGFECLTASNGAAALEVYAEHREKIVLVLLDLAMPEMDGEETFAELRRMRADLPVILSSGYTEEYASERFADKGLSGFIQKPYRLSALSNKLQSALED